jgi:hypothetical protein
MIATLYPEINPEIDNEMELEFSCYGHGSSYNELNALTRDKITFFQGV